MANDPSNPSTTNPSKQLSSEDLERIRHFGEICRPVRDAAMRQAAPVVAQAQLVWEQEDVRDEADSSTADDQSED